MLYRIVIQYLKRGFHPYIPVDLWFHPTQRAQRTRPWPCQTLPLMNTFIRPSRQPADRQTDRYTDKNSTNLQV